MFLRTKQAIAAVLGALAFFFVLKGAAMATASIALNAPLPAEAGFASTMHHWVAGPDPVSSAVAMALRG